MNNIGDLKIYAVRNGKSDYYKVKSPLEAKRLIFDMSMVDLKNDDIDFNMFGLMVYDGDFECSKDGWCEWYNDDGENIREVYEVDENLWLQEYKSREKEYSK